MSILLNPHLDYLQAAGHPTSTVEARWAVCDAADRQLPYGLDEADTGELARWLAGPDHPRWTNWTRTTYFSHLAGLFRWAHEFDLIRRDPTAKLRRPRPGQSVPNPVTQAEVDWMFAESGDWWRRVFLLGAKAGLRAGEIVNLEREDVTEDLIRVRHGKGDKTAFVETDAEIWGNVRGDPPGLLVRSPARHRQMSSHSLSVMARKHFDAIGLPRVHLHRLRHYYATTLLAAGVDVRVVQELMRHTRLDDTAKYTLVTNGQRRLAIRTLPALGGHPHRSPSAAQDDMPADAARPIAARSIR